EEHRGDDPIRYRTRQLYRSVWRVRIVVRVPSGKRLRRSRKRECLILAGQCLMNDVIVTDALDPSALSFLSGGGEMGARIRAFDWTSTPLGPPEFWSPALRTMLRILLANRFPHILWWRPDYIQFY